MRSVLEEIYHERFENGEILKRNPEYKKFLKKSDDLYEELDKVLTEEQKKILDNIWLADAGLEYEAGFSSFKDGIKTFILILVEIFKKE